MGNKPICRQHASFITSVLLIGTYACSKNIFVSESKDKYFMSSSAFPENNLSDKAHLVCVTGDETETAD